MASLVRRAGFATASVARQGSKNASRVVFSGIQPTGVPHLGNYAGALRQWVKLQHDEPSSTKLIYSVVDLHAITVPQPPEQLRAWRREALASLLAIGIDPDRSTLFFQSAASGHSELMWILSCTASVGYLSRMTQWKSKLSLSDSSSLDDKGVGSSLKLGLFSYPVLQAADVLVHRATHVPVGRDQHQHLEFARECATNFNHTFHKVFPHPQTMSSPTHKVMSLNDPTSKMSKSNKSERSRILLTDTPQQIKSKIGSALTDSISGVTYDTVARPGISNLLDILSLFDVQGRTPEVLANHFADVSPRQLKETVTEAVINGLKGVRERYVNLLDARDNYLDIVAKEGARKAQKSSEETMTLVRDAIGL